MQILVLGMHRSGTSLATRLINMMGAYFGPEGSALGPNADNPKGFWERHDVLQCNDAILQLAGCRWNRLHSWPPSASLPPELKARMQHLILGMDAFRPWVMKDPRLCATLPFWRGFLEVPLAVIVHRDPLECARSLELRDRMAPEWGLALWEYSAVGALNASAGMQRVFVGHAELIADPVNATARLHAALRAGGVQGLRLPHAAEITAFVEPRLYRSRVAQNISLSPWQRELAAMLRGEMPAPAAMAVSPVMVQTMERYSR